MLNVCFLIAVTITTYHRVMHECITNGTMIKLKCQVIRHIHFLIGCGCGDRGVVDGGSIGGDCCSGGGGGVVGSKSAAAGGRVRPINLLMFLFPIMCPSSEDFVTLLTLAKSVQNLPLIRVLCLRIDF